MVRNHTVALLPSLSSGLWSDYSPFNAPEGAASQADNILFNLDGSISSRPGYTLLHGLGVSDVPTQLVSTPSGDVLSLLGTTKVYLNSTEITTTTPDKPFVSLLSAYNRTFALRRDRVFEYRGTSLYSSQPPTVFYTRTCGGVSPLPGFITKPYWDYVIGGIDREGNEVALWTGRMNKCPPEAPSTGT